MLRNRNMRRKQCFNNHLTGWTPLFETSKKVPLNVGGWVIGSSPAYWGTVVCADKTHVVSNACAWCVGVSAFVLDPRIFRYGIWNISWWIAKKIGRNKEPQNSCHKPPPFHHKSLTFICFVEHPASTYRMHHYKKPTTEFPSRWWSQIFFNFHPYLRRWSNLTNIFQMGWFNMVQPPTSHLLFSLLFQSWIWSFSHPHALRKVALSMVRVEEEAREKSEISMENLRKFVGFEAQTVGENSSKGTPLEPPLQRLKTIGGAILEPGMR